MSNHCGNGKNVKDDKSCRVAHCVANCKITRECIGGRTQAVFVSYGKEMWDEVKQHTYDPKSDGYDEGDQEANRCGRDFARKLPERTCETLCKDTDDNRVYALAYLLLELGDYSMSAVRGL